MKKCLFLVLMFISMSAIAQESYKVFCELLGTGKLLSNKVTVTVDFGQETSFWSGASKQYLVDGNGKAIKFNSMVDAMNYMGKRGWEFEQAYVVTTNNQNVYHWLLSKEITQDEAINEDFNTKQTFFEKQKSEEVQEELFEQKENVKSKRKRSRVIRDDVYN
ncbi:hypothetical protein [Bacteroides uniformis]|uniref:hypothetical protein n=1 Tax=Bacteroides uniformis TaxID=820 RepID=UPI00356946FA